ncbi:ABC transporter permease [Phyllobacterium sp. SB3]|uniref:ABC transporter permease n=1 Tax=Phyllobacterium sp. SB3 TaxID=3156073 RepID=UPI0032AE91B2
MDGLLEQPLNNNLVDKEGTSSLYSTVINLLVIALKDIWGGLQRYRLWLALAKEDVLDSYRHTSIGVLWAVFSFSFFALAILLVFGLDSNRPAHAYIAHLVTGLLAWNFISAIITQGVSVFTSQESFIKGSKLPLSLFTYHVMARNFILDGFAAIAAMIFLLWNGYPTGWHFLGAIPALILYALTAIPVQLLLGSLGAYTRDVKQIIDNIMRATFFLTPVIWTPSPGTHRAAIANLNPLTAYIEVFRVPFIENRIPWDFWLECIVMTGSLWVLAILIFAATRRHIVFWL